MPMAASPDTTAILEPEATLLELANRTPPPVLTAPVPVVLPTSSYVPTRPTISLALLLTATLANIHLASEQEKVQLPATTTLTEILAPIKLILSATQLLPAVPHVVLLLLAVEQTALNPSWEMLNSVPRDSIVMLTLEHAKPVLPQEDATVPLNVPGLRSALLRAKPAVLKTVFLHSHKSLVPHVSLITIVLPTLSAPVEHVLLSVMEQHVP